MYEEAGTFGGTHPVTKWAISKFSFLGRNAVLLYRCDGANGEVCGSLATCVQEGMRSVARLRHTEGLSGVPAVWPAFIGVSGTVTVLYMFPVASAGVLLQWVDFTVNVSSLSYLMTFR